MEPKSKKSSISNIKQQIISNKKYSIAFGIILLLIFIILIQNLEILDKVTVEENDIIIKTQSIKKLQNNLKKTEIEFRNAQQRKEIFLQKSKNYRVESSDGETNINIQKIIETAAKESGIELKTLGTIRTASRGNGINNGEFDISCSGEMKQIIEFINMINNTNPKMYWERCLLRPDNIKNPKKIYLTGYLKFIIIKNEDIINLMAENTVK